MVDPEADLDKELFDAILLRPRWSRRRMARDDLQGLRQIESRAEAIYCSDGTRPVIFKVERIDIPETDDEI